MDNNYKNLVLGCNKCKQNFTIDQDDFSFYEKMKVPPLDVCPDCRFKMRALWRNEMSLYNRKCDKNGNSIISMYNPKSPYRVFSHEFYESDKWDAREYKLDYDFSQSFFEQFKNLFLRVPKQTTFRASGIGPNINSEYVNYSGALKDSYFVFNSGPGEEIVYSRGLINVKDMVDCYFGNESETSYESVNCQKSSKVLYGNNVSGCVNCIFATNLSGCMDCFCCVNLRNKSNYIFNQQYEKEEYKTKVLEILGSYNNIEKIKKEFKEFEKTFPNKENHNLKTYDSSGDYIFEGKNVLDSFEVTKGEDIRYAFSSKKIKDSHDVIGYGIDSERLLNCVSIGGSANIIGGVIVENSRDIIYSHSLKNCHDCIGCDGLRNAEYCILNKQYEKAEYEKLKEHIIKELTDKGLYGLMMPPELAPFAYNETIAQDNMPLTKEEALAQGFRWEDDIQMTKGKETRQPEEIPDHIKDISDDITKEILKCISCERNYKITEQELLFYRKMILPIPRKCFFCRHQDRIKRRGPYKFWDRKCDHCGKDIKTNYSPDRPEIVYCEQCYQQEVI
jgi:hypothetical protein